MSVTQNTFIIQVRYLVMILKIQFFKILKKFLEVTITVLKHLLVS